MHGDVKLYVFHIVFPLILFLFLCRNNILLDENYRAKLGDFGFCREVPKIIGGKSVVTTAIVAQSAGYVAPESDAGQVSPKSDMISYGVVCHYFMLNL